MKFIIKKECQGKVYVCEKVGFMFLFRVFGWAREGLSNINPMVFDADNFRKSWGCDMPGTLGEINRYLSQEIAPALGADRLWAEALS